MPMMVMRAKGNMRRAWRKGHIKASWLECGPASRYAYRGKPKGRLDARQRDILGSARPGVADEPGRGRRETAGRGFARPDPPRGADRARRDRPVGCLAPAAARGTDHWPG